MQKGARKDDLTSCINNDLYILIFTSALDSPLLSIVEWTYLPFNISFIFHSFFRVLQHSKQKKSNQRLTQFSTIHRVQSRRRKVHFTIAIWWSRRRKDFVKWALFSKSEKRKKKTKNNSLCIGWVGGFVQWLSKNFNQLKSNQRNFFFTWQNHRTNPKPLQHAWEKSVMRVSLFRLLFVRKIIWNEFAAVVVKIPLIYYTLKLLGSIKFTCRQSRFARSLKHIIITPANCGLSA